MMSRVGKTEGAGALHRGILEARLEKRAILPNFNVDIRDPKFLIGLRLTESNLRFRNFGFEMGFCPISQFPPAGYSSTLLPSQRRGGCAIKKCRGATKAAQTGWCEARVRQGEASIEEHGRVFAGLTTPSAPIKVASRSYWCRGHP